jgi:hypothetical protein
MSDEELEKLAKAKALQDLPMDEASRLARAKEMGFDLPVYHGTTTQKIERRNSELGKSAIQEFLPNDAFHGKGIYFSPEEQLYKVEGFASKEGGHIYPTVVRGKKIFNTGEGVIADSVIGKTPSVEESFKTLSSLSGKSVEDLKKLDRYQLAELIKKYPKQFEGLARSSEVVIFDPKNIRSKFAKFDPAMAESADISSFVPKTTGEKAVGAALKGLGVLDKGLAHAGKLAIGADIAQGNIPEAAISAAEFAAPKIGAAATRVAPFLDLLRPETTQSEEQEQSELEQVKFNKLKQALKKRGLAVE